MKKQLENAVQQPALPNKQLPSSILTLPHPTIPHHHLSAPKCQLPARPSSEKPAFSICAINPGCVAYYPPTIYSLLILRLLRVCVCVGVVFGPRHNVTCSFLLPLFGFLPFLSFMRYPRVVFCLTLPSIYLLLSTSIISIRRALATDLPGYLRHITLFTPNLDSMTARKRKDSYSVHTSIQSA